MDPMMESLMKLDSTMHLVLLLVKFVVDDIGNVHCTADGLTSGSFERDSNGVIVGLLDSPT